jgi:hypothetical protein
MIPINFIIAQCIKYVYFICYELLKFNNYFIRIAAQKNKRSGETPPTFLQKNEFLETPLNLQTIRSVIPLSFQDARYLIIAPPPCCGGLLRIDLIRAKNNYNYRYKKSNKKNILKCE